MQHTWCSNLFLTHRLSLVLSKFLDVEHLISMCIQIPKREDAKTAEMKITEIIHLKHTLELVEQLRIIIQKGSNPLFITYFRVRSLLYVILVRSLPCAMLVFLNSYWMLKNFVGTHFDSIRIQIAEYHARSHSHLRNLHFQHIFCISI